ncbi:MAG: sulfur carrier protein ThiS [Acidimicrobiales bacterium]
MLNGDAREVPRGSSVAQLIEALGIDSRGIAVAVDGVVVPSSKWADVVVHRGAHIEVLAAAPGG